jgi:hypothetical protein
VNTVSFGAGDLLSVQYSEVGSVPGRVRFGFEYRSP